MNKKLSRQWQEEDEEKNYEIKRVVKKKIKICIRRANVTSILFLAIHKYTKRNFTRRRKNTSSSSSSKQNSDGKKKVVSGIRTFFFFFFCNHFSPMFTATFLVNEAIC